MSGPHDHAAIVGGGEYLQTHSRSGPTEIEVRGLRGWTRRFAELDVARGELRIVRSLLRPRPQVVRASDVLRTQNVVARAPSAAGDLLQRQVEEESWNGMSAMDKKELFTAALAGSLDGGEGTGRTFTLHLAPTNAEPKPSLTIRVANRPAWLEALRDAGFPVPAVRKTSPPPQLRSRVAATPSTASRRRRGGHDVSTVPAPSSLPNDPGSSSDSSAWSSAEAPLRRTGVFFDSDEEDAAAVGKDLWESAFEVMVSPQKAILRDGVLDKWDIQDEEVEVERLNTKKEFKEVRALAAAATTEELIPPLGRIAARHGIELRLIQARSRGRAAVEAAAMRASAPLHADFVSAESAWDEMLWDTRVLRHALRLTTCATWLHASGSAPLKVQPLRAQSRRVQLAAHRLSQLE